MGFFRCVSGTVFLVVDLNQEYDYKDLGCADWPLETVTDTGKPCGPADSSDTSLIEIGFAVSSEMSNKVLFTSCLNKVTYQSLWSKHVVPSVIDQRTYYGKMPYFSDDGLYDFQLEVYNYYTKNMQR